MKNHKNHNFGVLPLEIYGTKVLLPGGTTTLIGADQFAKLKALAEKRTGWTSKQLEHRVKRRHEIRPAKAAASTVADEDIQKALLEHRIPTGHSCDSGLVGCLDGD